MVVLYALVCTEQNSSKIILLEVIEQFLVGNTFATDGEIGQMATPIFIFVLPTAITVSPEPLDLEGCVTTQNVRNGHIMGGQSLCVHVQNSMVFKIFAKNSFQHGAHYSSDFL